MSVNYNRTKSLKGLAVGTIIPWSGPISGSSGIPKGWLACTGRSYPIDTYPELFDIIGYRYTPGVDELDPPDNFNIPNLPGRSLGDYHPSHASDCGYPSTGNFTSSIPTTDDIPVGFSEIQSSNVDLRLNLQPITGNLKANMTGMNLSAPSYTTTFAYVPRRLGDGHMGTHTHSGSIESVSVTNVGIEQCQDSGLPFPNCGLPFNCYDNCTDFEIYKSGNAADAKDDFCVPKYDGGEHLGRNRIPYGTSGYRMSRTNGPRNFIRKSEDCLLYNERAADFDPVNVNLGNDGGNWQGIYATTLMTDNVEFQTPNMTGHDHSSQSLSLNSSNVLTRESIRINTISTGTITPVNVDTQEIVSITANVSTPSIQMLFIIKVY